MLSICGASALTPEGQPEVRTLQHEQPGNANPESQRRRVVGSKLPVETTQNVSKGNR
jgi:hypothetical protein